MRRVGPPMGEVCASSWQTRRHPVRGCLWPSAWLEQRDQQRRHRRTARAAAAAYCSALAAMPTPSRAANHAIHGVLTLPTSSITTAPDRAQRSRLCPHVAVPTPGRLTGRRRCGHGGRTVHPTGATDPGARDAADTTDVLSSIGQLIRLPDFTTPYYFLSWLPGFSLAQRSSCPCCPAAAIDFLGTRLRLVPAPASVLHSHLER